MKKIILSSIALALMNYMLISDDCCGRCKKSERVKETKQEKATINTDGLKKLIDSGTPLIILDARTGKWDDGKRIPGAKTLSANDSDEKIAQMLPNKSALIVTYCGGIKCPASNQLAERLIKLGYTNVIEYPEGIAGWAANGNKVEK